MIGAGSANKLKFSTVELDAFRAHDLLEDQTAGIVADNQPVGFCLVLLQKALIYSNTELR